MEAGRDLDILIAEKVMGWKQLTNGECKERPWLIAETRCHYWHDSSGKETKPLIDLWTGGMGDRLDEKAWSPSTDIAAAFKALFKVCSDMGCGWQIERHESDGRLYVTINGQGKGEFWEQKIHSAKLADIPYAICLVSLMAVSTLEPEVK